MSEHISLCMLHCMGPGEERSVGNSDKLHADRMSAFSINNNASRVHMYILDVSILRLLLHAD